MWWLLKSAGLALWSTTAWTDVTLNALSQQVCYPLLRGCVYTWRHVFSALGDHLQLHLCFHSCLYSISRSARGKRFSDLLRSCWAIVQFWQYTQLYMCVGLEIPRNMLEFFHRFPGMWKFFQPPSPCPFKFVGLLFVYPNCQCHLKICDDDTWLLLTVTWQTPEGKGSLQRVSPESGPLKTRFLKISRELANRPGKGCSLEVKLLG